MRTTGEKNRLAAIAQIDKANPCAVTHQGGGMDGDRQVTGPTESPDIEPGDEQVARTSGMANRRSFPVLAPRSRPEPLPQQVGVDEGHRHDHEGRVDAEDGPEPGQVPAAGGANRIVAITTSKTNTRRIIATTSPPPTKRTWIVQPVVLGSHPSSDFCNLQ